jgi:hypothetical protein
MNVCMYVSTDLDQVQEDYQGVYICVCMYVCMDIITYSMKQSRVCECPCPCCECMRCCVSSPGSSAGAFSLDSEREGHIPVQSTVFE